MSFSSCSGKVLLVMLWQTKQIKYSRWEVKNILTCPWTLTLIQHPLITAESAVEPHGVVQGGCKSGPVSGVRQQRCAQECIVRYVSSNAAMQLHVAFTCINTQTEYIHKHCLDCFRTCYILLTFTYSGVLIFACVFYICVELK